MEKMWIETRTKVETLNWRGEPLRLESVKALQDTSTGKIRIRPYDLAQAEIEQIASEYKLEPRDVATFTILMAKPGNFKEGEVLYKYHLQKMLFYFWKELTNYGFYEAMPRDDFESKKNGPVPAHIEEDLSRLLQKGLIQIREERWHPEYPKTSKRIILTDAGLEIASQLWEKTPYEYRKIAINVKERLYPMEPEKVRHLVHMEYPEYQNTYIENDIE